MNSADKNTKLINLLKITGYIFSGSDIYGGVKNTWDYGPLGLLLKNNISKIWEEEFIFKTNSCLININTLLNPNVWKSSGHFDKFFDFMVDCKNCKKRYKLDAGEKIDKCLKCGKINFTPSKKYNLMLKTNIGVTEDNNQTIFMRPELAQGIFINYKKIYESRRMKLPFGIGQIGYSYRNEITPGHFIFKTREFTQMELEYFVEPNKNEEDKYFLDFDKKIYNFLVEKLLIDKKNIEIVDVPETKLAHYSSKTHDYNYKFSFGFEEIWGLAKRGDYDIKQHDKFSSENMKILHNNKQIIPYVVESSVGLDRLMYATLYEHYNYEKIGENNFREVLKLPFHIAPYKFAVLSLTNKENSYAIKVFNKLTKIFKNCTYDISGSIGKKYRRQDLIGTPFCITIDNKSTTKNIGTIRFRDDMSQKNIDLTNLYSEIKKYI